MNNFNGNIEGVHNINLIMHPKSEPQLIHETFTKPTKTKYDINSTFQIDDVIFSAMQVVSAIPILATIVVDDNPVMSHWLVAGTSGCQLKEGIIGNSSIELVLEGGVDEDNGATEFDMPVFATITYRVLKEIG